jgi:hypothetical protein
MAEKQLIKNKGDLNVCILRPSIIASSYRQPTPGWTDSLAAAGGLTMLAALGIIKNMFSTGNTVFDLIPADYVTNSIIIVTAFTG